MIDNNSPINRDLKCFFIANGAASVNEVVWNCLQDGFSVTEAVDGLSDLTEQGVIGETVIGLHPVAYSKTSSDYYVYPSEDNEGMFVEVGDSVHYSNFDYFEQKLLETMEKDFCQ